MQKIVYKLLLQPGELAASIAAQKPARRPKKAKKASDAAAKIARLKITKTQLAAIEAANQWQLH